MMLRKPLLQSLFTSVFLLFCVGIAPAEENKADYPQQILQTEPTFYWSMDQEKIASQGQETGFEGEPQGKVKTGVFGPRPSGYPDFAESNTAIQFLDAVPSRCETGTN